jgi:glycine cleavage system H protein
MSQIQLYFTPDHEWIRVEGGIGTVGVSDHAQQALGDVVFVELPALGQSLRKGGDAAVVESVKAASEVYSPVSGEVVAVNQAIVDQPGLVNQAAEGDAWFFRVALTEPTELDGLMAPEAYQTFLRGLG